ncbi:hypothetical protein CPB86DRAFT_694872 [Serendipita vermifera]|nr:hypothetical protein CPB86DRAFT_694872 [Serendipita vermifera]
MPVQFPEKVITNILQFLYASPEYGTGDLQLDLSVLHKCSLISRAWRSPVQSLLFYHANLTSIRKFMQIRQNLRHQAHVHLTVHVRVLSLGIGQNYQTHVQASELPSVLAMFPALYELRLNLDNPGPLPLRSLQMLESPTVVPPIRALRINIGSKQDSPDFILQLLLNNAWPLEHLSITQPAMSFHATPWITAKDLHELNPPAWKLIEYRTDAFLNWQVIMEWVALYSLESIRVLHMPPAPNNITLGLISPRLKSLNLVYDPNGKETFEGMDEYPPFPELLELNLTNALLIRSAGAYQSVPQSVTTFGTTLKGMKVMRLIEICPTIPMRMERVMAWYEQGMWGLEIGWEGLVKHYTSYDGRLEVSQRNPALPYMVPFVENPRFDGWAAKKYMDGVVAGRMIIKQPTPPTTPKLLRMLFPCLFPSPLDYS